MAANFQQHMGGPGQMMPQQQQQQQQQRQNQNGPAAIQIQSIIFNTLNTQTGPLSGWQAGVLIQERISLIFNIIGNLRLASQHQPNAPPLSRMIDIGIRFEKDIFEKSPDKETYKHEVQLKLEQLLERRNQNQASLQQSINQQAQAQAQAQQAQAQQMMMNQNGMQGQGPRAIPQQPAQQGFSHLQHQMTASPLPGQQSQQAPMGIPNQGMPQNMPQNQQQFQMSMQQQQQPQTSQNIPGRQTNAQPNLSQEDNVLVINLTTRLMTQASEEQKNELRASLQARMEPQIFQKYISQGQDPLFLYYRNQALNRLRAEKQARLAQAQQLAMSQQPQNMPAAAPPMQQQRSMNPSPLNGQTQPPVSMGGNQDFGTFMGDLAAQQQQQGVMAQEAGQMVVPASGAPRNATPQPGVMAAQSMGMNDQRGVANPNSRVQQQQQMFNAQQVQQQRMQHAAQQQQQQSQVQARLNAQAKAQQIALQGPLQGQPGGLGPGPMPPQPSPAMANLNAPLRTPSQQTNHPEQTQVNPNGFGQPLDPRFMQGRQPGPGNGTNTVGMNPAMLAGMPLEQQQRLANLPPEKLNEVVTKWHEQRAAQMNASNMQAGRPQMSMQANGQMRPGQQMPQPGQFTQQNAANQFMANQGQRAPQSMTAGMNPQQQLMLQQQMAAMRPQNQMQQRNNIQQNIAPGQQTMAQMDGLDIPPIFQSNTNMPQGIPPDIRKWGQLKHWAAQNPNLSPDMIENVRRLQMMHYQQMVRTRTQQQGQTALMQAGAQGGQMGMPTAPPGVSAPVAPMVQHQLQIPNGMNMPGPGQMRQITQQQIQDVRNHPSGKMATATDDQIRALLMRTPQAQLTPQQQQQRQLMQMQMQMTRMAQANNQRSLQQTQPNVKLVGPNQNISSQVSQQKQSQPSSELATPSTAAASTGRVPQAQPNNRNATQNSSPAPPPKNLKRASSDDVVEVPKPNSQQPRQTPHQAQAPKQVQQQPRTNLTREQIAALEPDARKKYEQFVRLSQANQVKGPTTTNPVDEKLRVINKEEQEKANKHPLPDLPMDQATKTQTEQLLRAIKGPLANVLKAVPKWFQITLDEQRARSFFQARYRLGRQFHDAEMNQLKETFSIMPKEVEHARTMLNSMVSDLTVRFPYMKKAEAAKPQQDSTSQAPVQPAQAALTSGVTPLNAANLQQLQQQQQQLNKLHQRSNSRSSHTPAAPTSSQPPFQFGATSPHGAPAYIGKTIITQENLHIPARKKQRQNNTPAPGQGTPGSTSSPQVAKAVSPDIKRQQVESKSQPKPSLCCPEQDCERHNHGFDSEEGLQQHTQEEHIRPLNNPLKYAQENLASTLGLDAQGAVKKTAPATAQESGTTLTGAKMGVSGSKQGQTPNIKSESTPAATTPMNRQVSMNRQSSSASAKPAAQSKIAVVKDPPVKSQAGQKDSAKLRESQPPQPTVVADPWANATIDPHDLFQSFQLFETGAGGAISDMTVYRSITPNDTPESSKDGASEPTSDISDGVALDISLDLLDNNEWNPFGPSEADGLFGIAGFNNNLDEDLNMFLEDQPASNFQSWDDVADLSNLDKPFSFDPSFYSMNVD